MGEALVEMSADTATFINSLCIKAFRDRLHRHDEMLIEDLFNFGDFLDQNLEYLGEGHPIYRIVEYSIQRFSDPFAIRAARRIRITPSQAAYPQDEFNPYEGIIAYDLLQFMNWFLDTAFSTTKGEHDLCRLNSVENFDVILTSMDSAILETETVKKRVFKAVRELMDNVTAKRVPLIDFNRLEMSNYFFEYLRRFRPEP